MMLRVSDILSALSSLGCFFRCLIVCSLHGGMVKGLRFGD
jgi:hypothetical protein